MSTSDFPLTYNPLYWGAVFPLGMYTACTWLMAQVLGLSFLLPISRGFLFIALAAWLAAFGGLTLTLARHGLTWRRKAGEK